MLPKFNLVSNKVFDLENAQEVKFIDKEAVYQPCELPSTDKGQPEKVLFLLRLVRFACVFVMAFASVVLVYTLIEVCLVAFVRPVPNHFLSRAEPFTVSRVTTRFQSQSKESNQHFLTLTFPVNIFVLHNSEVPTTLGWASVEVFEREQFIGQRSYYLGKEIRNRRNVIPVLATAVLEGEAVNVCCKSSATFVMVDVSVSIESSQTNSTSFHSFKQKYIVCCSEKRICAKHRFHH